MTPQEAKQKAIIEAYGEYWHIAKNYADENGWISFNKRDDETPSLTDLGIEGSGKLLWEEDWDDDLYGYRPKSLQGIENNNGWTRIEPDGSNLPKHEGWFNVFPKFKSQATYFQATVLDMFNQGLITHYHEVKPRPNPIY